MPPKSKTTREEIIAASLRIVRSSGYGALSARSIAKELNCSTQPIFSNYPAMEDIKADVIRAANEIYERYTKEAMNDSEIPSYKSSGLAYIRFAKEEKELFKLLFMRDRTSEKEDSERHLSDDIIDSLSGRLGIPLDKAQMFHAEMWIFVHGIATMTATSYLDWDWDIVSRMISDIYQSKISNMSSEGSE